MITALAFERLGCDRLTAWANTRNGRSQRALERIGFRREGVLSGVAPARRRASTTSSSSACSARRWERSALHDVPVTIEGTPPPAFVVG